MSRLTIISNLFVLFTVLFSCTGNVMKHGIKDGYYQVDASVLGGNNYNDVNDIIKIEGDSFYHLHSVIVYNEDKQRFEKVKNNVLLIDKGILKIMDDGYYIFISERDSNPPTLEYEVVQNGSQFTRITSRTITKYDLKDTVEYDNGRIIDRYQYRLVPSNIDSIKSIDIDNFIFVNGTRLVKNFVNVGTSKRLGNFVFGEVSDTINSLQVVAAMKCGGHGQTYPIPNLSSTDIPSGKELEIFVPTWYPFLRTDQVECCIPPGSDVKITVYLDVESFNASWLTGSKAIFKGNDIFLSHYGFDKIFYSGFNRLKKIKARKLFGKNIKIIQSKATSTWIIWVAMI